MAYERNVSIDLEFTPVFSPVKPKGLGAEIIEVGASMLDAYGAEIGTFSEPVRPTYAKGISRRVSTVTGIGYNDLAHAGTIEEVLPRLVAWIGDCRHVRMITWDNADRRLIADECVAKGIDVALPGRWLDLQRIYPRLMGGMKKRVALGTAADECGISFERRHRALCDAQATGQIFRMAVSGELAVQRDLLASEIKSAPSTESFGTTIADRCGGSLADLLASLTAQEALAYA